MIYKPAKGSRLNQEQAQRYGTRIYDLIEEYDGTITPQQVLDDARDDESPLHDFFEWNNRKAAEHWRVTQANYLLRSLHVVIKREDGEEETRFLYNVKETPEDNGDERRVYVSIQRMSEADLREQVIQQALNQLINWRKRYKQYQEFADIFTAIDAVREVIG